MSEDHINVTLECPECHVAPCVDDENDDSSPVYCPKCNAQFGTYGDVKDKAAKAAGDHLLDQVLKPLENSKLWKITRK